MTHRPSTPPPIEPLSDISWQRIENGVFSRLDREPLAEPVVELRSGRGALWVGGAALAAAAGLILWFAVSRIGDVDQAEQTKLASIGALADASPAGKSPSRIVTTDAPSHYNVADAALTIAPESAILVSTDTNDSVLVVLERGELDCKVAPRRADQRFSVQAGDVRIEVIGTKFSVSRAGEDVTVAVTEGTVLIISGGERTSVSAGQTWPRNKVAATEPPVAAKRRASRSTKPTAPKPTLKERFKTAQRLQSTDPKAAAAIFVELAKRGGPWGRLALFAHAELEIELGHKATARRLLNKYLDRYPSGPNARDARELLDKLK